MQGIKNIIFDLGGDILNLDNQHTEDPFTTLGVKDIRNYLGHGHASSFFKEYEVGRISDQQFVDAIRQLTGLSSVSDKAIIDSWNALVLVFPPERIQLLKELRKSYRLFLFSNTNALHLAALQQTYINTFGGGSLEDHFEKTYYSHLLGMRKPDRESFKHILQENQLNAGETLLVHDAIVNVSWAELAEMTGRCL